MSVWQEHCADAEYRRFLSFSSDVWQTGSDKRPWAQTRDPLSDVIWAEKKPPFAAKKRENKQTGKSVQICIVDDFNAGRFWPRLIFVGTRVTQSWALEVFFNFFNNKKLFFCIFYQVNNLFLHQSYLKIPLPVKLT